jgi:DNA-binding transcriptional ArsR family regulator
MGRAKPTIDHEQLDKSSDALRAICHPLRMHILRFIDENETVNVNNIYTTLDMEQSITSQHLRALRLAKLVEASRDGKFIHYRINYPKIEHIVRSVRAFLQEDTEED